jgi:uncharacterized MnhB-related membrane protein
VPSATRRSGSGARSEGSGRLTAWLIGGPLVDGPGWEWIFYINIPVGLAALALSPMLLRESRAATARRSYDPFGALTITGALALLVYTLVEAPDVGWGDAQTVLLLAGSAALLGAFVLIESRHRAPLVRLGIFRSRTIVGANAVMLVFGALPFGLSFILTLYAQQVLGYSAVKFGLTSLVFPVMAAVGSILGQRIVLRVGFRPVAAVGMALMGGGALILTQVSVGGSYFGDIFFGLLVFGPGVGLAFVTASIAALAGAPSTSPVSPPASATRASRSARRSASPSSPPSPSRGPTTTWPPGAASRQAARRSAGATRGAHGLLLGSMS